MWGGGRGVGGVGAGVGGGGQLCSADSSAFFTGLRDSAATHFRGIIHIVCAGASAFLCVFVCQGFLSSVSILPYFSYVSFALAFVCVCVCVCVCAFISLTQMCVTPDRRWGAGEITPDRLGLLSSIPGVWHARMD